MFSKLFGVTCVRPGCGNKNPKGTEFCEKCGISLDFNRPTILDGNQWQPAPDELAAFFKFKDMCNGFFTKTLYVPSGMKAWVLQDDLDKPVVLLNEGAHTTATLFQRMNNFFRSAYGDVLVAKTSSVPVNFEFDDLCSLEGLLLKAGLTLRVRVRVGEDKQRPDLAAFRRHFMQRSGVVSAELLTRPDVLGKSVKAALSSYVRARRMEEMAVNPKLALEIDGHLRNQLSGLLLDFGLELLEVTECTLLHQRLDEQRRQQGEVWLLRREQQQQQDRIRQFNDLYDSQEREAMRAREMEILRKQQAGELDAKDADLAHALSLRELQQYERILSVDTREEAARLGGADQINMLQHIYKSRRNNREQEALGEHIQAEEQQAEWKHLQALARIRRDAALKIEAIKHEQELRFQHERVSNALHQEAANLEMKQALALTDELQRRVALAASVEEASKARMRAQQLASAQTQADADAITLVAQVRRMEAERLQRLADAEVDRHVASVQRQTANEDANDKLMRLSLLVEIDHQDELNTQRRQDERLDKELDRKIKDRQQQFDHDLKLKEIELRKISLTGSLPPEQLVLLASDPHQIDALVKLATLKAHNQMTPEAIMASAQATRPTPAPVSFATVPNVPAASAGPSLLDEVRRTQQDDRVRMNETFHAMQTQNAQYLGVIERMASGLRDVGVANATGSAHIPPTVVVAPVVSAPAAPAVLQQAFITCGHCRSLNAPSVRYCSSCGQPLTR